MGHYQLSTFVVPELSIDDFCRTFSERYLCTNDDNPNLRGRTLILLWEQKKPQIARRIDERDVLTYRLSALLARDLGRGPAAPALPLVDGGAVGRGLVFVGCIVSCRDRSADETPLRDRRALGLRRRSQTRMRGLRGILSAARSASTSLPPSRGHSTIRARDSSYPSSPSPSLSTMMIIGKLEASGAERRPRAPAGRGWTEDRGSVVVPATGCGQGAWCGSSNSQSGPGTAYICSRYTQQ